MVRCISSGTADCFTVASPGFVTAGAAAVPRFDADADAEVGITSSGAGSSSFGAAR